MKSRKWQEEKAAWAEGKQIQAHYPWSDPCHWQDLTMTDRPNWDGTNFHFRIKPEPAAKVYPVSKMTSNELFEAFDYVASPAYEALSHVANAALRHAIDAGQVVTMDDHTTATTIHRMRGEQSGSERNARRDMSIARAVGAANLQIGNLSESELARIIATVKD